MSLCTSPNTWLLSQLGCNYIVTVHTWPELKKLLKGKHESQSWRVYASEIHASSPGKAKARFMRFNELDSVTFVDLKCKLKKNVDFNLYYNNCK